VSRRSTRRDFVKQSALAGLGFWSAGGVSLAQNGKDKVNIACIGVGGKGSSDTDHAARAGNLVAICDIDENHLNAKSKQFPDAKRFTDFRKMLEELGKSIDAVTVSTPDHTHAPAAMMAMKLGKHVYCQKPLTHSVFEARALRDAAKKYKVATQMGNQGTAHSGLRTAVEVIQGGAIGAIKEVHVWTNRCSGFWKQAPDIVARPKDAEQTPKHVNFDLFLGPAPERPYSKLYHPFAWRGWRDFGTGALGDMACHTANMAFMALKLAYPTSVAAENSEVNPETFQQWATIHYEFPARGELPPVKLTWYEGVRNGKRNLPTEELFKGEKAVNSGSLFIGEKGTLYSPNDYGASYVLLPKKDFDGFKAPEARIARHKTGDIDLAQKEEWVAAIKGGPPALSNFDYAAVLTETMILGNVAIVAGKKIEYDGANMKVTNNEDANRLLRREYRKGWTL
jgi:predicted dehydrogenase